MKRGASSPLSSFTVSVCSPWQLKHSTLSGAALPSSASAAKGASRKASSPRVEALLANHAFVENIPIITGESQEPRVEVIPARYRSEEHTSELQSRQYL